MTTVAGKVLTFPYRIASLADRLGNEFDARQWITQPEHCTVTHALALSWTAEQTPGELSNPNCELKQENITKRFQTLWSLYRDKEQLVCSSDELLLRLNWKPEGDGHWLLMISYRSKSNPQPYIACLSDARPELKFPPYSPTKRSLRPPGKAIESIEVVWAGEGQMVAQNYDLKKSHLESLLGPNRDFLETTAMAPPDWLILRLARGRYPQAQLLRCKSSSMRLIECQ